MAAVLSVLAVYSICASPLDTKAAWNYAARHQTQALIIQQNGRVLFEQYSSGGHDTKRMLASGTKSFNGVLLAAAVDDGLVKWNTTASELIPSWKEDARKLRITLRQLISLDSGLGGGQIGLGGKSWDEAVKTPARFEPGTRFQYGPTPFFVFGSALENALKGASYEDWLKKRLLDPLGITVEWTMRTAEGKPQNAGGASMTARDWASFGQLLLDGGRHRGRTIVKAESLAELVKPTQANPSYGVSFWLGKTQAASAIRGRSSPADERAPLDLYQAVGAGNQKLMIVPSLSLVIVRLGPLGGARQWDDGEFFGALLGKASPSLIRSSGSP